MYRVIDLLNRLFVLSLINHSSFINTFKVNGNCLSEIIVSHLSLIVKLCELPKVWCPQQRRDLYCSCSVNGTILGVPQEYYRGAVTDNVLLN